MALPVVVGVEAASIDARRRVVIRTAVIVSILRPVIAVVIVAVVVRAGRGCRAEGTGRDAETDGRAPAAARFGGTDGGGGQCCNGGECECCLAHGLLLLV